MRVLNSRALSILLAVSDDDADAYRRAYAGLGVVRVMSPGTYGRTLDGMLVAEVFATPAAREHRDYKRMVATLACIAKKTRRPERVV